MHSFVILAILTAALSLQASTQRCDVFPTLPSDWGFEPGEIDALLAAWPAKKPEVESWLRLSAFIEDPQNSRFFREIGALFPLGLTAAENNLPNPRRIWLDKACARVGDLSAALRASVERLVDRELAAEFLPSPSTTELNAVSYQPSYNFSQSFFKRLQQAPPPFAGLIERSISMQVLMSNQVHKMPSQQLQFLKELRANGVSDHWRAILAGQSQNVVFNFWNARIANLIMVAISLVPSDLTGVWQLPQVWQQAYQADLFKATPDSYDAYLVKALQAEFTFGQPILTAAEIRNRWRGGLNRSFVRPLRQQWRESKATPERPVSVPPPRRRTHAEPLPFRRGDVGRKGNRAERMQWHAATRAARVSSETEPATPVLSVVLPAVRSEAQPWDDLVALLKTRMPIEPARLRLGELIQPDEIFVTPNLRREIPIRVSLSEEAMRVFLDPKPGEPQDFRPWFKAMFQGGSRQLSQNGIKKLASPIRGYHYEIKLLTSPYRLFGNVHSDEQGDYYYFEEMLDVK